MENKQAARAGLAAGVPKEDAAERAAGRPARRGSGTKTAGGAAGRATPKARPRLAVVEDAGAVGTAERENWAGIVAAAVADGRLEADTAPAARSFARQIDRLESCFDGTYRRTGEEDMALGPDWLERMGKAEKLLADLKDRLAARMDGGGRIVLEGFPPPPLQDEEADDGL